MKKNIFEGGRLSFLCAALIVLLIAPGCYKVNPPELDGDFKQVNLVASVAGWDTARIDPLLGNAWGLAFSAGGTPWIASQSTHVSNVYNSNGAQARAAVNIPSPTATTGGSPTGVVFNLSTSATEFVLSNGQRAQFIFVGDDGVLSAWNGAAGNNALRISTPPNASYTGLAMGADKGALFLYAANFKARRIDVFDKNFALAPKVFVDPYLPGGYSPFNIQLVHDRLYVMYAKVGWDGEEEVGKGLGFVDIFATDGTLLKRFVSGGWLNAPWGVAAAPTGFLSNDKGKGAILVGNFGDGKINAYSADGEFLGALRDGKHPIVVEGLWAISFPPLTATTINPMRLYFCAGPKDETAGLFGYFLPR